ATARVGRQTRNSDGIFSRFDGALFTWKPRERTAVNLAVGSPVDSSADAPAKDDRYFVSASADFEDIADRVDLTVYGIEQRAGSLVDRRAVGAEVQYIDDRRSFFGAIDYDLHYKRISSLVVSGSITNPDSSTISARADYVHSPGLVTTNALQGQAANTLDQLLQTFSVSQISELALDRTAETASLNVAYSRPLDEKTQLTVDGTLYHTGGNPASGGVAAVPAPGLEFFASAQLVRSDIFRKGDVASATLRYANTVSTDLYLLDVYSRYPVSKKLRLRPRIKLGYRNLKTAGGSEVFVIPSMTANYQFTKTTSFELELSSLWSSRKTGTTRESSNEIGIVAGYRVEF
ncbi:MAG: hypothetical protein ACE5FS_04145, partial [Paracoccaceae bacterium]